MPNVKKIQVPHTTTAVTVQVRVKREADGYLLNDADGAFASAPADSLVDLTEHGTLKGLYELSESRTVWNDGLYTITAYVSTGLNTIIASGKIEVLDDVEVAQSLVESAGIVDAVLEEALSGHTTSGSFGEAILRILGLCLDNHVEDDIVRDSNNNKTSSTLYFYDTAANATTHDKSTGLIGKTNITATYASNLMTLLKGLKG